MSSSLGLFEKFFGVLPQGPYAPPSATPLDLGHQVSFRIQILCWKRQNTDTQHLVSFIISLPGLTSKCDSGKRGKEEETVLFWPSQSENLKIHLQAVSVWEGKQYLEKEGEGARWGSGEPQYCDKVVMRLQFPNEWSHLGK